MRRAERLYRLRSIKDSDGGPALTGDVLRALLFVRDGWGWVASVRDAALRGYDKSVAATLRPVAVYTKRRRGTEDISFALDANGIDLPAAEKYAVGMLANNQPLDGATMRPLYDVAKSAGLLHGFPSFAASCASLLGMNANDGEAFIAEGLFTIALGFAGGNARGNAGLVPLFRSAIENLDDRAARESLQGVHQFIRDVRRFVYHAAIAERRPGFSTNPLTMFGIRQHDLERDFRERRAPRRITPAQLLALFVGIGLVADQMLNAFATNASFLKFLLQRVLTTPKTDVP